MGNLEFKDICCYLPYKIIMHAGKIEKTELNYPVLGIDTDNILTYINGEDGETIYLNIEQYHLKPILRPLSDLYKAITHNGKEIVPLVELAKISYPGHSEYIFQRTLDDCYQVVIRHGGEKAWKDDILFFFIGGESASVFSSKDAPARRGYQLFDYLHELKIDYRGLILKGLAVDVNTLDINPYK
jgi:hypothetical protein